MAEVCARRTAVQGFEAIEVENGLVAFTLIPDLGAKLSSLRDLRSGREWLWTSNRLQYRCHAYGASYVALADTGGWDECFPTVAACDYPLEPWRGVPLPDHGELWSSRWETRTLESGGGLELHSVADGVAFPYRFERSVRLEPDSDCLKFRYVLTNLAGADMAFIWSAHPLFRLEPGMRVRLPDAARLNVYLEATGTRVVRADPLAWPVRAEAGGHSFDLNTLPGPEAGLAFKLWSEPLTDGWTELEAPDGRLRFEFDVREVPQVGLWLNAGGWSGAGGSAYDNLALEPCIGAQDSLEEAVLEHRQYRTLPARRRLEWSLAVRLGSGRSTVEP